MAHTPAGGNPPKAQRVIVYVHTDQGVTGIGEGREPAPIALKAGFGELLIGEDPCEIGRLWQKLFDATASREPALKGWTRESMLAALAAIDAALWDLLGKVAGLPLYRLLGGHNREMDCYVTGAYYREGAGDRELVEEMEKYLKLGYRAIKIKVGGASVDEDVRRAKLIRRTVGKDVVLMVDANKGWRLRDAIEASKRLSECDFLWLEEPLQWHDEVEPLVRLKKDCPIPLAAGEHEMTRHGVRRLIATGAVDWIQFDGHKFSGPTEWLRVAHLCDAHNVMVSPHREPQMHGHLMTAIPNGRWLETFANPDREPWWFELYTRRPEVVNGKMKMLDEPGIGVEIDQSAINKYGTKLV